MSLPESGYREGVSEDEGSRTWPWIAVLLAVLGGASYHFYDTVIFRRATFRLLDGQPLYLDPGASYFPPVWYVLALPVWVVRELGLPAYRLFPWILSAISVTALVAVGVYGARHLDDDVRQTFVLSVLCNPLTILGVIVWSQTDALVALGVVPAVIGFSTGRYRLFGVGLAWGAIIKIAPALMLLPGLAIAWEHRRDVVLGVSLVAIPTALTLVLHDAVGLALDPTHGLGYRTIHARVWHTNPLALANVVWDVELLGAATLLTAVGTLAGVGWSLRSSAPAEFRLLGPVAPAILLYPGSYPYRWLPLALAAFWLGLRYRGTREGRASWRYGWLASIAGGSILLLDVLDLTPGIESSVVEGRIISQPIAGLTPDAIHLLMWAMGMATLLATAWLAVVVERSGEGRIGRE